MSKKKNNSVTPVSEEEQVVSHEEVVEAPVPVAEEVPVPVAEETPVRNKQPKKVKGTVVGCVKLNVREQMNLKSAVLCVLPASSTVKVIADEKHDDWYHIFAETGIEGFCMKKYIQI